MKTRIELSEPIGAHLSRDFTTLRSDLTVAQALDDLRGQPLGEKIVYFYVVDAEQRLVGVVPTRRLLTSPTDKPIASIMVPRVIAIPISATVGDACEHFVLHRFLAFPVVDDDRHLCGIVSVSLFTDEVFDMAERRAHEDAFQLIGVRLRQGRRPSAWEGFRSRFPWLLCNIFGGVACALLSSRYESLLGSVIVLALFVPVVLALAESVSMQSMTITLHGLHEARVDWEHVIGSARRELATALLLGVASGAVVGSVVWIWKRAPVVGCAVGSSIALSILTACLLGVLLPTAVRAFRGDPSIAAGPIVLATADLATLLFYFNVSGAVLG